MENTDTVSVEEEVATEQPKEQEVIEEVSKEEKPVTSEEEQKVPLNALLKERTKKKEAEARVKVLEEMQSNQLKEQQVAEQQKANELAEEAKYEAATKADVNASVKEAVRLSEENRWIKENPEKAEQVNTRLTEFLKYRPNLASAIRDASNRYEEAWDLIDKLTPKQKVSLKKQPKANKDAPNSPSGVSKGAGMNQAIDVMDMTDAEYTKWRTSKRKRR